MPQITNRNQQLRASASNVEREIMSKIDAKTQELFDMWGVDSCECIGFYHYDEKKKEYVVDDLRKPNFDHIPYYPNDKAKQPITIVIPSDIKGIKQDEYYLFTWKLSHGNKSNPYEIQIDFKNPPRAIEPKWFVDTLFNDRHNDKSKNFGSATNFLDTLSKQLSAKESTFVYELLQNANDYPVAGQMVDVEFHITDNYLLFLHSGDKFNVRNISGICGINEKEKIANKRTIGYKGIGFKTVFLHNRYVYLQTGDYSFRFDESEIGGKIKRLGAPFQILPIWTEHNEVAPEVTRVFDVCNESFRVRLALRPEDSGLLHDGKNSYENLFKEIFEDANIILFIPNINSVRVVINGKEERFCIRNNEEWIVGDYEEAIQPNLQEAINKTIEKGNSRIPEKYKDFDFTKVSFACKHEGALIKPVERATLYCYLPTKASWGFPFLMNTDMIPKGDRNDIETEVDLINTEDSNFNKELAEIAGSKLFVWIRELLTSRKYDLGSVFSLIPDFKKCKKEHDLYEQFIEKFEGAFDTCLEQGQIVPVKKGIVNVKHVIYDTTGLTTSGIMTDEEFCKFAGMEGYHLPLRRLRTDKNFKSFHRRYAAERLKFTEDKLLKMIRNREFKKWIKIQGNNDKFLKFLLDNDFIKDYFDKEIFIEEESGKLYTANDLYYDIDEELEDLSAFSSHLCYLSFKTREFFDGNKKWEKAIKNEFNEFDGEEFITDTLLIDDNWDDTVDVLKDWDASYHFYKYLAKNKIVPDELKYLPFFDDEENVVDDFEEKFVFLASADGKKVCADSWLSGVSIAFVAEGYDELTIEYFKANADVRDYSDEIIINDIILSDDYYREINSAQQKDYETSESFVKFCYEHESLFEIGSLKNYALNAVDCSGDYGFVLSEDHIYFPSECFDDYSQKEWIDNAWMYCLDADYHKIDSDKSKVKAFLEKAFYISDLSEESFYDYVVKKNLPNIIKLTCGSEDWDGKKNIDFIHYLDENFKMIFEEKHDADEFKDFKPVSDVITDLTIDSTVYVYDEDLAEIIGCDWFPKGLVNLCNNEVRNSRALVAMGCSKYNFRDFFDDVISKEISSINDKIKTKEQSVAFHNFIISHLGELTQSQQEKMKDANVFLLDQDEPAEHACAHKTMSKKAQKLLELGLIETSNLDIIDPDYKTEENAEYWENRLGNTKYTVNHFYGWLKDNIDEFSDTISDEDLNISFWRWLKENVSDNLPEVALKLPLLLKDGTIDAEGPIYFSDEYMNGAGIESTVKRFDEDAKFLSPEYIHEDEDIAKWKDFFAEANVKCEVVDILVETIIPNLSTIDDEGLVKLLANNREALESKYEDGLAPHLISLRVKARDGEFYSLKDTIYVDCEKEEPFPYIILPNQISFDTADERRLIEHIITEIPNYAKIDSIVDWRQRKVDCYLKMQKENTDKIRDIHYQFINDLSFIRNSNNESIDDFKRLEGIKLLNRDEVFCEASKLTVGSKYNPFFDFEACGITELEYVSDLYGENCSEYPGRLFRTLKLHLDFQERDIQFLGNRDCALYFWEKYLVKKDAAIDRIKKLIEEKKFDGVACIPTKDSMKRASELYYGVENRYVKKIEDWENKIPLTSLPDVTFADGTTLFGKMPFKRSLDFADALYALFNIKGQDTRTQLLQWMIDGYDECYDSMINKYREDEYALWNNNNNVEMQIKELYALDYRDKALEQYFGTNVRIINKAYFPTGEDFNKACDILGIKTITSEDLKMEHVNATVYHSYDRNLKLYALVISGMIDCEKWKEIYKGYCDRLDSLILHRCKSILITYKEDKDINQSLKKFYHKEGENDFYFVDSLDGKRVFKSFVEEYIKFLDIDTDEIAEDVIEDIMDSRDNALAIIKEQNSLMLDEDFTEELNKLIPGIKRELSGNKAAEDDSVEDLINRPTFSTTENTDAMPNEDTDDENEFSQDADNTTTGGYQNEKSEDYYEDDVNHQSNSSINSSLTNERQRKERSDKGESHDYPTARKSTSSDSEKSISSHNQSSPSRSENGESAHPNHEGWNDSSRRNIPSPPKPFSQDDVHNFVSHGVSRTLDVLDPTNPEVDDINRILGEDLTPEQIADQNYLAQLRLYNNLIKRGYTPKEDKDDFVKNANAKEHAIGGGKYIHKCSAAGGIMYLSPAIWNKIADDKCVVCVYLGAKANEFMYFNSIEEILEWIKEDDIVIKLNGQEKADVVETLYSGVLNGVKGTAYTLIRINSNEKYNSLFAPLENADINEKEENEDEY